MAHEVDKIIYIVQVNILATLRVTHDALAHRDKSKRFHVVITLCLLYPIAIKATYTASKRFLLDFAALRQEELRDMCRARSTLCWAHSESW